MCVFQNLVIEVDDSFVMPKIVGLNFLEEIDILFEGKVTLGVYSPPPRSLPSPEDPSIIITVIALTTTT